VARSRSRELFPTDSPVAPERLIGRQLEVARLQTSLHNGVNQVVLGPRRTGKTSVCRAALTALAERGTYVASLDLFALATPAELAAELVAACVANRGLLARGSRRLRSAGRAARGLAGVTLSSSLQAELGQDVEVAFSPALAARDPERSLDYALGLPQRIAEKDDVQLVLFLDEFQEVAHPRKPFGDPDALTKRMRAVLQDSPRVTTLFTGSVDHLMNDLFTPQHRAFFRYGETVRLPLVDDMAWMRGLAERYAEDAVTVVPGALESLVERTGGHARSTMLLAQQAHLALLARGSRELDLAAVDEGFYAALAADSAGHQSETERLRDLGSATLETAKRLARRERPYSGSQSRQRVDTALARLLDVGIVERLGRGDYVFTDPLLGHYLSRL